jgi:hypothetical protein
MHIEAKVQFYAIFFVKHTDDCAKCCSIFLQVMEKVIERSPETLEMPRPGTSYTFFVPTDQAFNRLGAARLERIMDDPAYLTKVKYSAHSFGFRGLSPTERPPLVGEDTANFCG